MKGIKHPPYTSLSVPAFLFRPVQETATGAPGHFKRWNIFLVAESQPLQAAGMKPATGGRIHGRRDIALQRNQFALVRIKAGRGTQ